MVLRFFFILWIIVTFQADVTAQEDSMEFTSNLQNEIFLHPADGYSAYTLKKNEFVYCQSPFTLPFPSWAWWGITDKITAEIDLLPLVGGLFQEPHLPVPSINFRFKLLANNRFRPAMAFETMFQYLWRDQNQSDGENLRIERQSGASWYNHINASWRIKERMHLHASAGVTYTQNLLIENKDTLNYRGAFFEQTVNPDFSLSLDWRTKPWISTHLTTSYGTTFVYLDNIPRKFQVSYGFRVAPFYKNKFGILRTLRAEFIGFYMWFADAQESVESLAPVFPYLYWQWTFDKSKRKQKRESKI